MESIKAKDGMMCSANLIGRVQGGGKQVLRTANIAVGSKPSAALHSECFEFKRLV
jgi:hypothetical protein